MSLGRNARTSGCTLAGLLAILAVVSLSTSTFAQSDYNPKWDLFVGYQWAHPGITVPAAFGNPIAPTPYKVPDMAKGFGSALTYNFDSHWGLEADLGQSWGSNNSMTTASIGPRFMWRTDEGNYFIHTLFGDNWLPISGLEKGSNNIGAILGGGVDLPINKWLAFRLFEADYVWSRHNYSAYVSPAIPWLERDTMQGARLRTGFVFSWGGAAAVPPAAACSVQPSEVMVGEPITATVVPSNFNPKHAVTYSWSGNGGAVMGKETSASIDTTNVAPGNYAVTAHVTDPRSKSNNEASCTANYTVKPLPPKNPPTVSISASPTSLVAGGPVSLSANCSSPDGAQVSVANWTSSSGTVSGSGPSATMSTDGVAPGPITVNATCTDSRGLTAQGTTQIMIENPPPPPVNPEIKVLEARLALHSVYFVTAAPSAAKPQGGLLPTQEKILIALATDFKKYLGSKPDAHLILEGHADIRGTDAYNQALTERRVTRVKSFLVEQGVPEANIETVAYGKQRNLSLQEVKDSVEKNPDLTTGERKRALARIGVIKLASNRRVDVTLKSAGQTETSVRQFPFNSSDAMSLIGGRESEAKKPAGPAMKKKTPMKKKQ